MLYMQAQCSHWKKSYVARLQGSSNAEISLLRVWHGAGHHLDSCQVCMQLVKLINYNPSMISIT